MDEVLSTPEKIVESETTSVTENLSFGVIIAAGMIHCERAFNSPSTGILILGSTLTCHIAVENFPLVAVVLTIIW